MKTNNSVFFVLLLFLHFIFLFDFAMGQNAMEYVEYNSPSGMDEQDGWASWPVWAKLLPFIFIVIGTIVAVVFNCKGKAVIFVNGWDMLLFLVAAVLVSLGEKLSAEYGTMLKIMGIVGVALSAIWTIFRSIRYGIHPILILLSLVAKLLFFYLCIVLFVIGLIRIFRDSRDHEITVTEDFGGDSYTSVIRVPKSDIELEYYSNKHADAIAPFIAVFLSRIRERK